VKAYHIQFMRSLDWPVFMDGRAHPPAWAPHTWTGFSTGQWVGNTLKITTTHLKDGYLKRGGPQTSDMFTMTDFLTRHGDVLTIVTYVDDPVYMDEPYVESTTYTIDLTSNVAMETCNGTAFAENGGTDRHHVPHFLPGQNTALTEWLKKDDWIPVEPTRGGAVTMYPEYHASLNGTSNAATLKVPISRTSADAAKTIAEQSPRDGQVHLLPVQGSIYLLIADGTNVAVSMGNDGVMLVNTGAASMSAKVLAAVNQLANQAVTPPMPNNCFGASCPGAWGWASPYMNAVISSPPPPRPIRYIVNTSAAPEHVGGNATIASAGFFPRGASFGSAVEAVGRHASIFAHENVQNRLSTAPAAAQPTDTFFDEFQKLPEYFNGEAVILYGAPAANSDGDSFVYFRHSEVIAAGNLLSSISYPVIDVEKGGSIQGVIDGLNKILDLAVAEYRGQGGTWVIPGRGRLSDTADVASYRNMLTMIRDRVKDSIKKGMSLAQIKSSHPTLDFDPRFGSTSGPWTTDMFVEAVYKSLQEKK